MTWSIVARDTAQGHLGVAIATCAFAVGALCPRFRWGVGALSSQSYSSPLAGERVLEHLAAGLDGAAAVNHALADDDGRAWRQIHGVSAGGTPFAYTGADCVDWCGHWTGDGVSVAGNMLAGPAVVAATAEAWENGGDKPFAERLLAALAAGEAAGGDKRGKQSAALRVVGPEAHSEIDIRVDDHRDPLGELTRLFKLFWQERRPHFSTMPTRADPSGITDPAARTAAIDAFIASDPHRRLFDA